MEAEADLMLVLLGMQMKFLKQEQVVKAGAVWAQDRSKSLTAILEEKGYLNQAAKTALEGLLAVHMEQVGGGDPGQSLATLPIDLELRKSLLALPLDEGIKGTLMELKATPSLEERIPEHEPPPEVLDADAMATLPSEKTVVPSTSGEPVGLREGRGERYAFKGELGRGGLGKVVEAIDTDFGREVAVKMMLVGGHSSSAVDRFLLEGRVAGKLPHPNIVPIYEIGVLKEKGDEAPYFTMAKIVGRDLSQILKSVEKGEGDARKKFTRPRLLRAFQEVCNAMAYAHDHGVIHRDLKPANVMVGDYGEVFVVDWGLAKVKGEKGTMPGELTRFLHGKPGETPQLTMEGQVLGTPAYMPPEQADGRVDEIDERSDIYSLGAILFELLTFRPPFEGTTAYNVIAKVLLEDPASPSQKVSGIRKEMEETGKADETILPEPIPPDLDEICLKALAKDKEKRFSTAKELSDEIQAFLEGEKERERKRLEAVRKVEEGRRHFARFREMAEEIEKKEKEVEEAAGKVKSWMPVEEKRPLWEKRDRLQAMREERMGEFGNAEVAFGQAMASDPSNPGGREGLCDLYLDRYFAAEKRHDREETALYLNLLSKHDKEGKRLAEIEKPGMLTLRTSAYPCGCLKPVKNPEWRVEIGEDPVWPWRDGQALPGEEVKDDDRPVPEVRVSPAGARFGHTDKCKPEEIEGVEVWIGKYKEKDKRLIPGPEWLAGKTPLKNVELERGSYLCLLRHSKYKEVRLPVRIERGGRWEQDVNLYRPEEIPEGFCYVPGGPFIAGDEKAGTGAEETRRTEDFFMARYPVTFGEYLAFLNAVESRDPEETIARQRKEGDMEFLIHEEGRWRLCNEGEESPLGFHLTKSMPVMGISWFDAMAFCAWKSSREGRVYTPPHEEEWEKAARGVDGRVYPWGDEYNGTYSNTSGSLEEGMRFKEPGSFPIDESPFGVMDLAGNMYTWCWNAPEKQYRSDRCVRGGSWISTPDLARAGHRLGHAPTSVSRHDGLRFVLRSRALYV